MADRAERRTGRNKEMFMENGVRVWERAREGKHGSIAGTRGIRKGPLSGRGVETRGGAWEGKTCFIAALVYTRTNTHAAPQDPQLEHRPEAVSM